MYRNLTETTGYLRQTTLKEFPILNNDNYDEISEYVDFLNQEEERKRNQEVYRKQQQKAERKRQKLKRERQEYELREVYERPRREAERKRREAESKERERREAESKEQKRQEAKKRQEAYEAETAKLQEELDEIRADLRGINQRLRHPTRDVKGYYALLGVPCRAALGEIKAVYRKLALQYHPDRNTAPNASKQFQQVTEAYKVLSNPKKRDSYDRGMLDVVKLFGL